MARKLGALLILTVAALVATQGALAKEGVNLTSYPLMGTKAGSTWNAQFEAFSHDGGTLSPAVLIRSAKGKVERFRASRSGGGDGLSAGPVLYTADVVFPTAGTWTYGVELRPGAPVQWFEPVSITAPPVSATPTTRPFDLPLWIVALLGALLLGAAGGFAARRHVRAWVTTAIR